MEYNLLADFLAKFSNFTPLVQALIIILVTANSLGFIYFLKQIFTKLIEIPITKLYLSKLELINSNIQKAENSLDTLVQYWKKY